MRKRDRECSGEPPKSLGGTAESTDGANAASEVEAVEFQGVRLTPLREQPTVALRGVQLIDRNSYRLLVDGLVKRPLLLSYADLLGYEQQSWLMTLDCVEGWDFTAKWTGPALMDVLAEAGVRPEAQIAIFHTADVEDGYTSLSLEHIQQNNVLLALKVNDLTLPPERGFPFQVVAKNKYGYKWAKWVTRIELSSETDFRGYWESVGYSNRADVGGPAFD